MPPPRKPNIETTSVLEWFGSSSLLFLLSIDKPFFYGSSNFINFIVSFEFILLISYHRYIRTRYEDIATAPKPMIERILQFMGLDKTASVDHFLDSHTEKTKGDSYSTRRNSTEVVFSWRKKSKYSDVQQIQSHCRESLDLLGLRVFENEYEYHNESLSVILSHRELF